LYSADIPVKCNAFVLASSLKGTLPHVQHSKKAKEYPQAEYNTKEIDKRSHPRSHPLDRADLPKDIDHHYVCENAKALVELIQHRKSPVRPPDTPVYADLCCIRFTNDANRRSTHTFKDYNETAHGSWNLGKSVKREKKENDGCNHSNPVNPPRTVVAHHHHIHILRGKRYVYLVPIGHGTYCTHCSKIPLLS
jgi:hypothetical protein